MALTPAEQEFVTWVKGVLPRHFFTVDRVEEVVSAYAKMFELSRSEAEDLWEQTLIGNATNLPPDFLNLHARDRGTSRQDSEADADLRARLQNIPDALTLPSIEAAVTDITDAAGVGAPAFVELRYDKAFYGDFIAETGTGGEFTKVGSTMTFTPSTAFTSPPSFGDDVTISGAAAGGNDGTFSVVTVSGAAVVYDNASGAAGVDATVSWTITEKDDSGNTTDGFGKAYLSRGYRMARSETYTAPDPDEYPPPVLIVILPFGTTAATQLAVEEAVRLKKAAGVEIRVERRTSP